MADSHAAPAFGPAALRVFDLGLGQMLWSRRTVFMALVAGGPVLIAVLLRALASLAAFDEGAGQIAGRPVSLAGPDIFGLMIWTFYLRFTVPVLGVFYGTALIADEVEDRTVTYLFTRPVARGAVLAGKYLAYLVCTAVVVLPSVVLVYFLVVPLLGGDIGRNFPALLVDLGLIGAGLAVYGAVFALVGAWFRRPLLTGLVFVFGWEPLVVVLPGYMKHLSVAYYLQGLAPHAMPQGDALSVIQALLTSVQTPLGTWVNLFALAVIWVAALAAAMRVVERREYVLGQ
ncbi:MAG: ABC transporter permease subunit [Acidobacteria bacterium]|nr:ABC transporter permease subunit [Acidobacteriota bacterium]